ncbi:MAG: hypothetical protein PUC47_12335 [Oscillospiraceae bacterium]|nr:hypothetical protein [Oscillospiraceae bacterium]
MDSNRLSVLDFLRTLVGQQLRYGIKSPDMDLYDFGFGEWMQYTGVNGEMHDVCTLTLHVACGFRVFWKDGGCLTFDANTSSEAFHFAVKRILGLRVKRVWLSDKNDLRLDFGECRVVFITREDGEESWRCFRMDGDGAHLVASNLLLDYER